MDPRSDLINEFRRAIRLLVVALSGSILVMASLLPGTDVVWGKIFSRFADETTAAGDSILSRSAADNEGDFWRPPDSTGLSKERLREITYGRELIANTARYLGPAGTVLKISNGMNCQNCHLDAGTKIFGNNYASVSTTYPKFRGRSGTVESIEKRVNDCFERSLNGQPLDTSSREMRAIVSYINWLGSNVQEGQEARGSGLVKLKTLERAADPLKGKALYETQCVTCHGPNGQGIKLPDGKTYQFPPLWGENSYNQGAGLYRLSTFAGFILANMPIGATYDSPVLTEQESWDIAAYVNSMPRPGMDLSGDWPDVSVKPVDHPFGPYADPFTEKQHKYGPFDPIKKFYGEKKQTLASPTKK